MTFIQDLQPYEVFIDKINKDLDIMHEIMKTLTDWYRRNNFTGYVFTFESLHDEIGMCNIIEIIGLGMSRNGIFLPRLLKYRPHIAGN